MKNLINFLVAAGMAFQWHSANAFCGFYVAQAGSRIFNNKSEVIIVRDGDKQTITMLNDYKGDLKNFAMVVPVPVVLGRNDIRIMNQQLFSSLDQYSAPRLVEYYDQNPCNYSEEMSVRGTRSDMNGTYIDAQRMIYKSENKSVKIEAQYSVDEYEILILSAKQSSGLEDWLRANGYVVPDNAREVLEPYIKDKLKFFAVKVNMEKLKMMHTQFLRPIQITFNTPRFMLPIRLGMANSEGEQDLVIYAFTRNGRVEAANYRTVEMPTARNIPTFLKQGFGDFYKKLFDNSYEKEGRNAVFVEYAWNVSPSWGVKCDPCTGNPPMVADLKNAGVDWVGNTPTGTASVFFTRLHIRYSRNKFPEDLAFIETPNSNSYQVREIITHPASGDFTCKEGMGYLQNLRVRRKLELLEMEALAGINPDEYPFYVELGSGTQIPLEQDQKEQKNGLPVWFSPGGHPPAWMLPVLLSVAMGLVMLFNLWRKRKPLTL